MTRGDASLLTLAASLALLAGASAPALGQTKPRSSANQGVTPMDEIDLGTPLPAHMSFQPPENPEDRVPFIHDSRFGAQLRSFYLKQDKFNGTTSEAWTLGGALAYQSGFLADLLRLGAVAYTSQPVYAPKSRDGTGLLETGQSGYSALGQLFAEARFSDQLTGALGRKEYSTPYINGNDSRMSPNTFEGLSVYGRTGGREGAGEWRYGGGYVTKIKPRNSDEFTWMSKAAGAGVNRGVYAAAANFASSRYSIGASVYHSPDILDIAYAEGKYRLPLGGQRELRAGAQFTNQRSTGENLLTGRPFSTHQAGVKGDLDLGAPMLTLAYTASASGAELRNPWSSYPGYTDVQVEAFNRAREKAVLARAEYDFSLLGAPGLVAYALYVRGNGVKAPSFNQDETDLNLMWAPKDGGFRGWSVRLRYAYVKQRGGGDPNINDIRVIVNYDFPER